MEYMAERKYISVIHDHRGMGKAYAVRGSWYMYGGGADAMLQGYPYGELLDQGSFPRYSADPFRTQHGLSGSSCYAAHHDSCMDMLIVCGSPSYNVFRPVGVALAKAGKTVFGPKHSAGLIEMMSFGSYAMHFKKEKTVFLGSALIRRLCRIIRIQNTVDLPYG